MRKFPEYRFVDTAFNGPRNRNKVVALEDLDIPEDGADHYVGMFRYREELLELVTREGSVAGHKFPHYSDMLFFDIDNGGDLIAAQTEAAKLVAHLLTYGISGEDIYVAFSGGKGFHVGIPVVLFSPEPSEDFAVRCKRMAKELAKDAEIDTSIYDANRIFRVRNTRHGKSGLFKVEIRHDQILDDIDEILKLAESPQGRVYHHGDRPPNENLCAIWARTKKQERTIHRQPAGEVPKNRKACIHTMLQGVEDERHNAGFRIIDHYRKEGFPADITLALMRAWGERVRTDEEPWEKMVSDVYEREYDFGCNDDVLQRYCSDACYLAGKKSVAVSDLLTQEQRYERYRVFLDNLTKRRFRTGFTEIDQEIRGVAPGEVLTWVAYSGTYKSAMLQHLLLQAAVTQTGYALFFSLEMPVEKVFEREVQMGTGLAGFEVERELAQNSTPVMEALRGKGGERVLVCDRGGLSLEEIEAYIDHARSQYGEVGVVGIDYMGLVKGRGSSEYEILSKVFTGAKELAKRANVPLVLLSQVNRDSADSEITMKSGKGTGAVEASADFLLGMWKEGEDKVFMKLLKNRNGGVGFTWAVDITRRSLQFNGLTRSAYTSGSRKRKEAY